MTRAYGNGRWRKHSYAQKTQSQKRRVRDRCNEAGLPQCSAHGLRKAGASLAAERGATTKELQAIFGWKTTKEPERYTQQADRRKLSRRASMLLRRGKGGTKVSHSGGG